MSIVQKAKQLVYPFLYKEKIVYIPENKSFEGKTVLLAGGTGAVGETIAEVLYRQRASIGVVGRNADKLAELAKKYDKNRFATIVGDITKEKDCEAAAKETISHFGSIDALVNATGAFLFDTLEKIRYEQWMKLMDINVNAAFTLSKAVIPHMKKSQKGTIIHLGSKISHNTNLSEGRVAYATTKYALEGFCYALNRELKQDHIRVCCLMPGTISTFLALNALTFLAPARVAQIVSTVIQMEDVDIESILFTSSFQTY
ncbi:N/A [soil metagenome]